MLLKLQLSSRQRRKRPTELEGKRPAWQTEWADANTTLSAVLPTDGKQMAGLS